MTVSTAAYTTTDNLVEGIDQFLQKGRLVICARGSAIGMNVTVTVGGVTIANDMALPFIGATGGLTAKDHVVVDQLVAGGFVDVKLRNTTAGALTTDYAIYFTPTK